MFTFNRALPESRLFLTAALYQPIVQVLLDEGPPLEINHEKVCDYFSPRELGARFGTRGTPEFQRKVEEFCENTKRRLDEHVRRFSHAIEQSLACFPSAIAYVIGRAHRQSFKLYSSKLKKNSPKLFRVQFFNKILIFD